VSSEAQIAIGGLVIPVEASRRRREQPHSCRRRYCWQIYRYESSRKENAFPPQRVGWSSSANQDITACCTSSCVCREITAAE